jgi:hypothetical protein
VPATGIAETVELLWPWLARGA